MSATNNSMVTIVPRPAAGTTARLMAVVEREINSYTWPAAAYAWTAAYLLADMIPGRRSALLARAAEFSQQRSVCGVHYRSDLEAGRLAGEWLAHRFLQEFRAAAGERNAITRIEECQRRGFADAGARAGNDGDFV